MEVSGRGSHYEFSPAGGSPRSPSGWLSLGSAGSRLHRTYPSTCSLAASSVEDYWDAQSAAPSGDPSLPGSLCDAESRKLLELRECLVASERHRPPPPDAHSSAAGAGPLLSDLREASYVEECSVRLPFPGHRFPDDAEAAASAPASPADSESEDGSVIRTPQQRSTARLGHTASDVWDAAVAAAQDALRLASPPPRPSRCPASPATPASRAASASPAALASPTSLEDEVVVARMVAQICARAVTAADLESTWRRRVGLLERRLGTAKQMTWAMLRHHRAALEAVEPWAQSLSQGGLLIGASLAGGVAALVALRLLTARAQAGTPS
ncbi:hypothetical protein ACKKBF_B36435 [Auxenochlorella protothecoides x Auxenochlorella symbiontica]